MNSNFEKMDARLEFNITGTLRSDFTETINIDEKFEPNQTYTHLHKSFKSLGRIESVSLILNKKPGKLLMKKDGRITIDEIHIDYMNGRNERSV